MNVPCQAAEKYLIAPILPQSRQDTLLPHLRSRSIGLLTYQPVRCSVHAPGSWPGKNASWRGWGGRVRSPAFLSRLNSTPMDFTFISDRAPPFYTNDSMQRPAFVGPQVTGGGVLGHPRADPPRRP